MFPFVLAALDLVGLESYRGHGVALALLSGAGVGLVALLGRRFGGPAVGLTAAAIAALHPMWYQSAGVVMSESLHVVLVPAVLLAALRVVDSPALPRVVVLGGLIGVAALNRPEALGFAVLVGVPAIALSGLGLGAALRAIAVMGAVVVLVVAPWLVRNERQVGAVTMATNYVGRCAAFVGDVAGASMKSRAPELTPSRGRAGRRASRARRTTLAVRRRRAPRRRAGGCCSCEAMTMP